MKIEHVLREADNGWIWTGGVNGGDRTLIFKSLHSFAAHFEGRQTKKEKEKSNNKRKEKCTSAN